jgi:Tfp pilus assembly protein PilF
MQNKRNNSESDNLIDRTKTETKVSHNPNNKVTMVASTKVKSKKVTTLFILFLLLVTTKNTVAWAEEISYLKLTAFFIKDKNYERAKSALEKAESDLESYSLTEYNLLKGLLNLRTKKLDEVETYLLLASKGKTEKPLAQLYLSEFFNQKGDYKRAIREVINLDLESLGLPDAYILKAQIFWNEKNFDKALSILDEGENKFPKSWKWTQYKINYLLEKNLYQAAWEQTNRHLLKVRFLPEESSKWAKLFFEKGQLEISRKIFEVALLFHPDNEELLAAYGQVKIQKGEYFSASYLFQKLAYLDNQFLDPTIQLMRKTGRLITAENLHLGSLKVEEKIKTKLALLLENEDYGRISAMKSEIDSLRLNEDDEINYALAYSQFVFGDYEDSEKRLTTLKQNQFIKKGSQLLSLITKCKAQPGECDVAF